MSKKIIAIIIAATALSVVVFVVLRSQNDFVIIVNEEKVSRDDFERELEKMTISQDGRDKNLLAEELAERTIERLIFTSYLRSLDIKISDEEMDARYQLIIESMPDVSTVEELQQKWGREGMDIYLIEKQFTEEIAYDKIFTAYVAQEQIPQQEADEAYENYLQGSSDLRPMSREDFIDQLKYQLVYQKIEDERSAFQETAFIEINL